MSETVVKKKVGRKLFKPGQSGNPVGRPKGSRNRMKLLAESLMGTNAKKIVQVVIDKALEGDVACLKLCMDRILPAQKAEDGRGERTGQVINIMIEGKLPNVIEADIEDVENIEDSEEYEDR